jgi:UMF1 family MFS transporter
MANPEGSAVTTAPDTPPDSLRNASTVAWIAFDFINSILIINGSLFYSQWLTGTKKVDSFWYGLTFTASTVLLLLLTPFFGAQIDKRRNGRSILFYTSLTMGLVTFSLVGCAYNPDNRWQVGGTLVCFGLINFFYQLSLVPYNWLLPFIKGVQKAEVPLLTGIGESFGNLGSVAGALLGVGILAIPNFLKGQNATIDLLSLIAIIYLALFFIDYLVMRKGLDNHAEWTAPESVSLVAAVKEYYGATWCTLKKHDGLRWYLFAFVLYADALLTVQLYLPVYMRERVGLSESYTAGAFALSLTVAGLGAYVFAKTRTQQYLRMAIIASLLLWVPVLLVLGTVPNLIAFWAAMVVGGFLFGVVWSASRAYLYVLAPTEHLGRGFGLYSVFQRCASIAGPLLWGGIMLTPMTLGNRYILAFSAMSAMIAVAIVILVVRSAD